MARNVNVVGEKLLKNEVELTDDQRVAAKKKINRMKKANPLRRVQLACHGWVRDPLAVTGDRVWCDACEDFAVVTDHAE